VLEVLVAHVEIAHVVALVGEVACFPFDCDLVKPLVLGIAACLAI
jgi:hypothetical protein